MIDDQKPQVVCSVMQDEQDQQAIATFSASVDNDGVLEIDAQCLNGNKVKLGFSLPQFQAGINQFLQAHQLKIREKARLAAEAAAK